LIGIITKIDSPYANVPMVRQWLENANCERIFLINNVTGEGLDQLRDYLEGEPEKITLEEAKVRQGLGLRDWDENTALSR